VGGQLAGELASQWAVAAVRESLRDLLAPPDKFQTQPRGVERTHTIALSPAETTRLVPGDSLRDRALHAVRTGNLAVYAQARQRPEETGNAGTTLTMALVRGDQAVIANVGDSRTYLLRGKHIRQITSDHSLIASLVEAGNVKPEDAFTHPARNVIIRSLGRAPDVEVDVFEEKLRKDDTLLLCSDGLWEMIRDPETIASLTWSAKTPVDACRDLVNAANAGGGKDNITVIVVRVE
jgi:protein phosphatase